MATTTDSPRSALFRRWLDIGLRSLHLVGLLGVAGGVLYGVALQPLLPWIWLTALSGTAMVLLSLWSNPIWLLQLRGLAIIVKLLLLALAIGWPYHAITLLVAVTLLSGVIAHAPGAVRYHIPAPLRRPGHHR